MKVSNLSKKNLLRLQTILEYLESQVKFFDSQGANAFLCIILTELDDSHYQIKNPLVNLVKEEITKMIGNDYRAFNSYLRHKQGILPTTEQANRFRISLINKWLTQVRSQLSKHTEVI